MEKKCENCRHNSEIYTTTCYECDKSNIKRNFEPKTQTNRQWLESLSDEEFGEVLASYSSCYTCFIKNDCKKEQSGITCEHFIKQWLQAEHKE